MSFEVPIILILIALPIYFLIKEIFKKFKIGSDKNRWLYSFISTLMVSPVIYFFAIVIWMFSVSYYPNNDFNKEEWISNQDERFKLSEDLIESKILIGKTKQEVIQLLGEDYSSHNNHITYDLGFVPGFFNIDPDVLDIYFEKGKVVKVDQRES